MWFCKLCNVRFVSESVEQHVYTNHVKPQNGGIKVYNCGKCMFTAEGFEDIALHCIDLGHEPTKVFKGLNYDEYLTWLFSTLEEMMCLTKSPMSPVPTKGRLISINREHIIDWTPGDANEMVVNEDPLLYDLAEFKTEKEGTEINEGNQMDLSSEMADHNPKSTLQAPAHEILKERIYLTGSPTSTENDARSSESQGEKNRKSSTLASSSTRSAPVTRKTYSCPYCPKLSYHLTNAKYHEQTHTGEKPFPCPTCEKAFRSRSNLNKHKLIHMKERIYLTGSPASTENDARSSESQGEKNRKSSTLASSSTRSAPVTRKTYSCPYCPKLSYHLTNAKYHEQTHTGEKPFPCPTCEKPFRSQSNLNKHKLIHTGEKPFECTTCGKVFNQKGTRIAHERIHTGEKPFECTTCGKVFNQKRTLVAHERIHTGEKPFSCSTCGNSFAQNNSLEWHKGIHNETRRKNASFEAQKMVWKGLPQCKIYDQ